MTVQLIQLLMEKLAQKTKIARKLRIKCFVPHNKQRLNIKTKLFFQ